MPTAKQPAARKTAAPKKTAPTPRGGARKKTTDAPKPRWSEQYERAAAEYGAAVALTHQKKWKDASAAFSALVARYGQELDLLEIADRSRAWLIACERHAGGGDDPNQDPVLLGIYHGNRGEFADARRHFERALAANPKADRALYALAAVLAQTGERQPAIARLREAIGIDDQNRIHALNDADFDPVRDEPEFIDLVEPAGSDISPDADRSLAEAARMPVSAAGEGPSRMEPAGGAADLDGVLSDGSDDADDGVEPIV